jgi:hypothetical protein
LLESLVKEQGYELTPEGEKFMAGDDSAVRAFRAEGNISQLATKKRPPAT